MLKHVHFIPLSQAEKLEGRPDVIVISIHDRHFLPNLRSGFRDVLRLHFDDYEVTAAIARARASLKE